MIPHSISLMVSIYCFYNDSHQWATVSSSISSHQIESRRLQELTIRWSGRQAVEQYIKIEALIHSILKSEVTVVPGVRGYLQIYLGPKNKKVSTMDMDDISVLKADIDSKLEKVREKIYIFLCFVFTCIFNCIYFDLLSSVINSKFIQ